MLLATGADQAVLDRICRSLEGTPLDRAHHIDFDRAWRAGATTLLHVEELPRLGGPPPATPLPLDDLIEAAEAPSVRRVLLVTARDDVDDGLRALRRSGAAYLVLRPAPLLEIDAVREAIGGRRILVPEEVASTSWLDVLAEAGARPRVVGRWRAQLGHWFGQATVGVEAGRVALQS